MKRGCNPVSSSVRCLHLYYPWGTKIRPKYLLRVNSPQTLRRIHRHPILEQVLARSKEIIHRNAARRREGEGAVAHALQVSRKRGSKAGMVEIVADVMKPLQTAGVASAAHNTRLLSAPTPSSLRVSSVLTPGEPDSTLPATKMVENPHRQPSTYSRTLGDIEKRSSSAAAEDVKKGRGSDGVVLAMRRVGLWKLREQAKQIMLMEVTDAANTCSLQLLNKFKVVY